MIYDLTLDKIMLMCEVQWYFLLCHLLKKTFCFRSSVHPSRPASHDRVGASFKTCCEPLVCCGCAVPRWCSVTLVKWVKKQKAMFSFCKRAAQQVRGVCHKTKVKKKNEGSSLASYQSGILQWTRCSFSEAVGVIASSFFSPLFSLCY